MAIRPDDLARRRQTLLSRSAAQRDAIAASSSALGGPMATLDSGVRLLRQLGSHPAWIAGVLVAIALIKPRRLVRAMEMARTAGTTWNMIEPLVMRLRRR